MKASTKLEPIANIRKQQEQNAGRSHGEALRHAELQQKQLNELVNYRNEYIKGFQETGKSGMSAIKIQEYHLFIKRLDDAIAQQKQQVANGQLTCESSQQEWMDKRTKSKIIDKVVENRQDAENLKRQQNEQREIDAHPFRKSENNS